jgi:hypothetical protein
MHTYEVRPRKDHRGVDLISDVLPFGRLCWRPIKCNRLREASQPVTSRRVSRYDAAGTLSKHETHEHASEFKEP